MYKKFDESKVGMLLEAGIDEFADKGFESANINHIAKKAGVSVGVIYKYYQDKDTFFLSCVEHSLKLLQNVMTDVVANEDDIDATMRLLIHDLIDGAEKHRNYYIMYNEITSGSCRKYAAELANKIETATAQIYSTLIEKAYSEGKIKHEGNPNFFAFFFDNLLMMLQFSFSCEYYKERMKIFCGEDIFDNKEALADSFLKFMASAIGME